MFTVSCAGGETRHLGDFSSEEEAAQAYYQEQVGLFNIAMVSFRQSRTEVRLQVCHNGLS